MATYKIDKMRAVRPSEKMLAKHPDRFVTIFGVFRNEKDIPLSITQKVITFDEAKNPATVIDLSKGILTLPDGQRGRRETVSVSQEDILADLKALRKA